VRNYRAVPALPFNETGHQIMQIPLEISFHNIEHSDWAEDEVREHVRKLEKIYARLKSCRVRVEQRADNQHHTIPPVVRIELGIPGRKEIVVAHEPERLQRKYQRPDLHNAINEAFRIASKQLSALKQERSEHKAARVGEGAYEFRGQIAELRPEENFGFVMTGDGSLLYFHRDAIANGDFDRLRRGDDVSYVVADNDTGPVASSVRLRQAP
jgi:cold shock CspA family protein/ribosome-associated translation inhibitor RaiA